MTVVLDTGALLAIGRGDRLVHAALKAELLAGRVPRTHGGVVGQAWRGGAGQARLARLFPALEIAPLDEALGRRAGVLLGRARTKDVADGALVLLAEDGDVVLTSEPSDLARLAVAAGLDVDVAQV